MPDTVSVESCEKAVVIVSEFPLIVNLNLLAVVCVVVPPVIALEETNPPAGKITESAPTIWYLSTELEDGTVTSNGAVSVSTNTLSS